MRKPLTAAEINTAALAEQAMRDALLDRLVSLLPLPDTQNLRDRFNPVSPAGDKDLLDKVAALEASLAQNIANNHRPLLQSAQKTPLKQKIIPSWPLAGAVADIARLAAAPCAMRYFTTRAFNIRAKPQDQSPTIEAGHAVQDIIQSGLRALAPAIPFLGEEGLDKRHPNRPHANKDGQFWLVDPIDGTKSFSEGYTQWSLNIALIQNGRPALGIVYLPATDRLYMGLPHQSLAMLRTPSGLMRALRVRTRPADKRTLIKSHADARSAILPFAKAHGVVRTFSQAGASIRLCRMAQGHADLYVQQQPFHELDVAAGHAVLEAAGGILRNMHTMAPITYGHPRQGFSMPGLIAASSPALFGPQPKGAHIS